MTERMAGLAKGLAVLEAFDTASARLTISDAARVTGLSRATARRCLMTLAEVGYLAFDGKYFTPTPRVLRLGATYGQTATLPQLAQSHLAAIRDDVQESASLAVLSEGESLFVARSEGARIIDTGVRVGARVPLHASATGHVLLAGLPRSEFEAYLANADFPARTPNTPTDPAALRGRVFRAAADGFAIGVEELELGLVAIAVPVKDSTGGVVAAMSVSASMARVTPVELLDRFAPVMMRHADALGRQL